MLAGALAGLALLVSGCGGGSSPQVANLGSDTTTTGSATGGSPASGAGARPPGSSGPSRSTGGGQFTLAGGSGSHMRQFAACMRSHGVPNFPDPNAQGVISVNSSSGLDPGSPQFQQAQQACAKELPNGGTPSPAQQAQMRQQALAYSACMRSHGLPNFPDPQFGSGGRVRMRIDPSSGIDPRSSQFQAAQKACEDKLPGKLGGASRSGQLRTG